MDRSPFVGVTFAACLGILAIHSDARGQAASSPTAAQALSLTPIQPNVSYTKPPQQELAECTIRPEKQNGTTAWVIRSPRGETLRRFADTNGDNIVDLWCYYDGGFETYRDIDSDFNKKADQYRWFNTGGTRWGVDKNEDGRVDTWKVISAPEVAEELVWAIKARDRARFELLLLTPAELNDAGFGREHADQISSSLKAAPTAFSKLAGEQKVITPQTEFADFYRTRPATLPAGTEGSTKDITIHDNASALVETAEKPEQVFIGTLVSVGPTWKLIEAPTIGGSTPSQLSLLSPAAAAEPEQGATAGAQGPPAEMQALMESLDKLDRDAERLPPDQLAANIDARADVLKNMVGVSVDPEMREAWTRQLADVLSSAAQTGNYPQGLEKLDTFAAEMQAKNPQDPLIPYVTFRRMWADYVITQQNPQADFAKIQEKWLADLEAFSTQYPTSSDSAEALLQLGMSHEFGGRLDQAKTWYGKLATGFPTTPQAGKARGSLKRLGSIGRPIQLPTTAKDVQGRPVNLARDYRGKTVLIQYWATWYDRAKQDMDAMKDLYAKYGGRAGNFEIVGVCLDNDPKAMQAFLQQNRYPWRQIHEPGGFDGPLANDMGVMTLPLMILIDQKGNVVDDNIFVAELETELQRMRSAMAQGAANGRQ